jgi:hypothetical protein
MRSYQRPENQDKCKQKQPRNSLETERETRIVVVCILQSHLETQQEELAYTLSGNDGIC